MTKSQLKICENCRRGWKICCSLQDSSFLFSVDLKNFNKKNISRVEYDGFIVTQLKKRANGECIFFKNGKCSIYEKRPIDCRFFPFDIEKIGKELYWIRWNFCGQKPKNEKRLISLFEKEILPKINKKEIEAYADCPVPRLSRISSYIIVKKCKFHS